MPKKPAGMKAFIIVVIGQIISFLGSGMTGFAMAIWIFEQNGSATEFSLLAVSGFAPIIVFSPIAGVLVDRWNRKLVMMLSDLAAGLTTVIMLFLFSSGNLEVWHLYILGFFSGTFQAFQFPAYSASIALMIPKEQYGRAAGLNSLAGPTAQIFAPLMAAALIHKIGVQGIMIIDIVTFVAAISALIFVFIPQPEKKEELDGKKTSILKDAGFGFKYIFSRPSLLGLQTMFFFINFVGPIGYILMTPMILTLAQTNPESTLGTVMTFGAVGGLLGGIIMSAWGGPKKRIHGVLMGVTLNSIFGAILMGLGGKLGGTTSAVIFGLSGSALIWAFSMLTGNMIINILNGSSQAIWMSKVPPELQGRVFSIRLWIAQITAPIAMLISGPLADNVFEPAMAKGGAYADLFGPLVGTGPGTGMASAFIISGALGVFVGLGAYLFPAVRNIDTLLPDHDAGKANAELEAEPQPAD
jgi:MFS family permease